MYRERIFAKESSLSVDIVGIVCGWKAICNEQEKVTEFKTGCLLYRNTNQIQGLLKDSQKTLTYVEKGKERKGCNLFSFKYLIYNDDIYIY